MALRIQITVDACDPHALSEWWADLLGYDVERDHDFVAGLLEQGIVTDDDVVLRDGILHFASAASMVDPEGQAPRMYFQKVPESKAGKNRMHLDIHIRPEDLDAEVERVVATGATFVEFGWQGDHRWAVMQDPEGNEFCLH